MSIQLVEPPAAALHSAMAAAGPASFVVGRDGEGHWLAVETHGLGGGIFKDRQAALRYAEFETDRRPGAVLISADLVALRL